MRRGDIYLVDFEPSRGPEANKARPAILVSNDGANRQAERIGRGVLAVAPMTSNLKRIFPFQVRIQPPQRVSTTTPKRKQSK